MDSELLNDLRNACSLTLQKEPTENCWYVQLSWLMIPPPAPSHCPCLLPESLHSKIVRGYTQFLQGFSVATLLAIGILFASVSILLTRSISPTNYWLFCLIALCIYSSKHFYNPQLNADSYPCKHDCPLGFSQHFEHVKEKHAFLPSAW